MTYTCRICGFSTDDPNEIAQHIKKLHNMALQDYYDRFVKKPGEGQCKVCGKPTTYRSIVQGYAEYCSPSCAKKATYWKNEPVELTCAICGAVLKGTNNAHVSAVMRKHLKREHKIYEPRIYYDRFVKKENEGKCPVCGKETKFNGLMSGYEQYCGSSCYQKQLKTDKSAPNTKLHLLMKFKERAKETVEKIKEKYVNFLKNDKRIGWSDNRTDPVTHVNYKDTRVVETVDGDKVEVKTEISCSTQRDPWTGNQVSYRPRYEECRQNVRFDEIIEDDASLDETEWCQ